jgi:hypothetical protein
MKGYKLISVKQLIGELYQDYNINNDDWVEKVNRHVARGLGIMQIRAAYKRSYWISTVKEYKSPLPCDNKMVLGVILPNSRFTKLPISNSNSLGNVFTDLNLHHSYKGGFDNNNLITNFTDEDIMFVYLTYPKDDEGYLMIPNEELLIEALNNFIIYKLSLGGYKHPIISLDKAWDMWNRLYPQARNLTNRQSLEEAERMLGTRTNPLFTNILKQDWGLIVNQEELSTPQFLEELNRVYKSNL